MHFVLFVVNLAVVFFRIKISPALAADDFPIVEPGRGTDDGDGQGTEMAGVALADNRQVVERLQPFKRETARQPSLRDMHLHRLPWPNDVLESLGPTQVKIRVPGSGSMILC